jgi:hypothetical protein
MGDIDGGALLWWDSEGELVVGKAETGLDAFAFEEEVGLLDLD